MNEGIKWNNLNVIALRLCVLWLTIVGKIAMESTPLLSLVSPQWSRHRSVLRCWQSMSSPGANMFRLTRSRYSGDARDCGQGVGRSVSVPL